MVADGELIVLSGAAGGRKLRFRERIRIGSAGDCELVLPDAGIAAVHATIEPSGDGYLLRSTAGVYVGDLPALDVELPTITKLDLGSVTLTFEKCGGGYIGRPTIRAAPANWPPLAPPRAVYELGAMRRERTNAALALVDDNRVLIVGGEPPMGSAAYATAELFSIDQRKGRELPLTCPRRSPVAIRLLDGRILIAGGGTRAAEIFDPETNMTSHLAPMSTERTAADAALLGDGRVVVIGGLMKPGPAVAEVYDPARDVWSKLAGPPLADAAIAQLDATRFLVAATQGGVAPLPPSAYFVFDAETGQFDAVPPPEAPRWSPAVAALGDGRALVLAGYHQSGPVHVVDRFDLATRLFEPVAGLRFDRTTPAVVTLATGRVLVAGGGMLSQGLHSAELFDPASGAWQALPAIRHGINPVGALARADGSAVIVGMHSVSLARGEPW